MTWIFHGQKVKFNSSSSPSANFTQFFLAQENNVHLFSADDSDSNDLTCAFSNEYLDLGSVLKKKFFKMIFLKKKKLKIQN